MLSPDEARARVRRMASRSSAGRKARAVQKRRTTQPATWPVPPPLTFVVAGPPQPKERARKRKDGRFYTPPATVRFESAVGLAGLIAMRKAEPARNYLPWPLRAYYRVTISAVLEEGQRADLDNITKSVLDALNGVLWNDDSQVNEATQRVEHAVPGRSTPGTTITVEVLPNQEWPPVSA